jgi:hypothetical protein
MAAFAFLLGARRERMARPALAKICSKAKRRAARMAATLSIAGF